MSRRRTLRRKPPDIAVEPSLDLADPSGVRGAKEQSLLWGTSWMTLFVVVHLLIKLVRGAIIPKLLLPTSYGLWSSLGVPLVFAQYADLGVQQRLEKSLPMELGESGEKGYWRTATMAMTWTFCVSVAMAILLGALSLLYKGEHSEFYRPALRILAAVLIAQNARIVCTILLTARQRFRQVALNGIFTSVIGLGTAIAGVLFWGVLGLVWALLVGELVGLGHVLFLVSKLHPPRLRPRLAGLGRFVRGGLVLLVVAVVEQLMIMIDQFFVLAFFEPADYGTYALASFMANVLLALSAGFLPAQPRALERWSSGARESSRQLLESNLFVYTAVCSLLIGPIIVLGYVVVYFYLPVYSAALPLMILLPIVAIARGPVILLRAHFLASGRERRLILYQVAGVIAAVTVDALACYSGRGMAFLILGSIVGYSVMAGLVLADFYSSPDLSFPAWLRTAPAMMIAVALIYVAFHMIRPHGIFGFVVMAGLCGAHFAVVLLALGSTKRSWRGGLGQYLSGSGVSRFVPMPLQRWIA